MLGVRGIPLAGIAWSFGVIALILTPGLMAPPAPIQGTSNQDPLSLSIAVLKESDIFNSSAVGVAGVTPNEVLAWRVVFNSPNRDEVFQDILASGSVPAQLYALAGLWFGDAQPFVSGTRIMRSQHGLVRTMRGCIVSTERVSDVVREIQLGSWSREFLAAGRLVPVH